LWLQHPWRLCSIILAVSSLLYIFSLYGYSSPGEVSCLLYIFSEGCDPLYLLSPLYCISSLCMATTVLGMSPIYCISSLCMATASLRIVLHYTGCLLSIAYLLFVWLQQSWGCLLSIVYLLCVWLQHPWGLWSIIFAVSSLLYIFSLYGYNSPGDVPCL